MVRAAQPPPALLDFLRAAGGLAQRKQYRRLLYISDAPVPDELRGARGSGLRKLVRVVTSGVERAHGVDEPPRITIPKYDLARPEKVKLALVAGVAHGLLAPGDLALSLVARDPRAYPDSLSVARVAAGLDETEAVTEKVAWELGTPEVVEAVMALAVEVGAEGWEGHPVGALFVLGDAARVMESSRQLGLNPFQGYSERERNLLDPQVREAVRPYATLDGAIVIRDDGVVVAAGRYLSVRDEKLTVPAGMGARHVAAASITAETGATAFAVSQTTGVVRIYRHGQQTLKLSPARRRI